MRRVVVAGAVELDPANLARLHRLAPDVGPIEVVDSPDVLGTMARVDAPLLGVVFADEGTDDLGALARLLEAGGAGGGLVAVLPEDSTAMAARLLLDGVNGIVLASSPAEELLTALRAVSGGYLFVPSRYLVELSETLFVLTCRHRMSTTGFPLTRRESDVLSMAALGEPNSEIAGKLFISEATVRSHMLSILRKLGARNRTEAVAIGYRKGVLYNYAGDGRLAAMS